jgi:Protein kinase domain
MFPSRASWFKHELQTHRLEWVCTFGDCESRSFETATSFQSHLEFRHRALFTATQIPVAVSQCREPVAKIALNACPLCQVCDCDKLEIKTQDSPCNKCNNVWEASLRKTQRVQAMADPSILDKRLYGTPKDFRRHLARHMEQLALFALPKHLPNEDLDDNVGSNNAAADLEQDNLSLEEISSYSGGSFTAVESLTTRIKNSEVTAVRKFPTASDQELDMSEEGVQNLPQSKVDVRASEGWSAESSEDMGKLLRRESFAREDVWASRPPPEALISNLDDFFPNLDLNEPVIEEGQETSPPSLKHPIDSPTQQAGGASSISLQKSTKMFGANIVQISPQRESMVLPNIPQDTIPNRQATFRWFKGQLIGKGIYSRVYLGMNATTGEFLAVKQVEFSAKAAGNDKARMKELAAAVDQEIDIMKDLDHVNIVQYLGCERNETSISIFLEYMPGGSVGSLLRKHGKFEEPVVRSLTRQTLDGLAYLHREGILHRNLKADNILLDLDGTCKISGFGISKKNDNVYDDDATNDMQGSVFWMAPEVVRSQGKGYSAKVDIWSLGCVVLEMFAGARPWSKEEAVAAIYKLGVANEAPPIPDDVSNTISAIAVAFMFDCFQM